VTAHLAVEAIVRQVPREWRLVPFRRLAQERGVRNVDLSAPSLSLSSTGALYERTDETDRQFASEQSSRNAWVVHSGDLVVNPMWLFGGAIGVSDRHGAVSPDYRVYRFSRLLHPRFVHHLLRSPAYRDQYRLYMRAETTFDRRITKDDFNEMPLLVPPVRTQKRIADYLDAETARIDSLIASSARQRALNEERLRAVVISEMVQLSARHGTVALRRLVACLDGRRVPLNAEERSRRQGEYPYYGASGVVDRVDDFLFDETLVLLGEDGAQLGDPNYPIAQMVTGKIWVNNHAHVLRADSVDPAFLVFQLNSFDRMAVISGATREKITQEDMSRIPVPNVSREVQARTTARLAGLADRVVKLNGALQRRIALLQERRQALITAAVTGQLEIPGVAA
jgi:type I restriction enzyme S subunit